MFIHQQFSNTPVHGATSNKLDMVPVPWRILMSSIEKGMETSIGWMRNKVVIDR